MSETNEPLQTSGQQISGEYYIETQEDTKPLIKMEEFGDLSDLLLTTPTGLTSNDFTDELTTPVFEKGPFNLSSNSLTKVNTSKNIQNLKIEQAPLYGSEENINFNDLNSVKDLLGISNAEISLNQNVFAHKENILNLNNNIEKKNIKDNHIFNFEDFITATANTEVINIVDDNDQYSTNMYTPENTPSYVNSPNETPVLSYANSPEDSSSYLKKEPAANITPKLSRVLNEKKHGLTLQIERVLPKVKVERVMDMYTLNTPDVLNEVVDLGTDFNILDLVNNEDISILGADDDLLSTITSPLSSSPSTPASVSQSSAQSIAPALKRKSNTYYEDEDYTPPSKKRSTVRLQDIDIENDSDSEYEFEPKTEVKAKSGKIRGRPPKNTYLPNPKESEISKYRELRDKNNEASRKSRLKRKNKEHELESEADELHIKNIKLKAQVEELEKMVSTFRNNLFQIITKK